MPLLRSWIPMETFSSRGRSEALASDVAVDPSFNIIVTGSTVSSDFPVVNADKSSRRNRCVCDEVDPAGRIIFSTYLGGSGEDNAIGVAVDPAQNIYV